MSRQLGLLSLCALACLPTAAQAKDLRKRVGIGFNSQIGATTTGGVSALSARAGLPTGNSAVNVLVEADLGFASWAGRSDRLFVGGHLLYGVVAEDNMNLYLGAGAGLLQADGGTDVRLQPGVSVDFFLFGLENLGFTTGWGINIDLGATTNVSSTASAILGAHYWF